MVFYNIPCLPHYRAVAGNLLDSIVVVNRRTFLAVGIFHFSYRGVGLGVFLDWPLLSTTLAFTVRAFILEQLARHNHENSDRIVS